MSTGQSFLNMLLFYRIVTEISANATHFWLASFLLNLAKFSRDDDLLIHIIVVKFSLLV